MSILKGQPQTVNYLSFDGVDDYVLLDDLFNSGWGDTELNDFSIEITYSTDEDSFGVGLFGTLNDSGNTAYLAQLNTSEGENQELNNIRIFMREDGNVGREDFAFSSTKPELFNNSINTLKFSYNNGNSLISINGVTQSLSYSTNSNPSNFSDFQYPFAIGALNNRGTFSNFTIMNLYDFKIYNDSTLFLHYDMAEGSGTTLVDKVGNNDATIVGATWNVEDVLPAIDNIYYGQPSQGDSYLSFDGVNDYIDVGTLGNWYSQNGNDWSIEITYSLNTNDMVWIFGVQDGDVGPNSQLFDLRANFQTNNNVLMQIRSSIDDNDETFYNANAFNNLHDGSINTVKVGYNNPSGFIEINGQNQSLTYFLNETPNSFNNFSKDLLIGANNSLFNGISGFSAINLYDFKIYNGSTLFLHYDLNATIPIIGNQLIDQVGNNHATIYGATLESETLYSTIDRVYAGGALVYGQAPVYTYELIADVEVTSNTTQIDFDNLNITKDDELRLVYTAYSSSTSNAVYGLYINDNNSSSSYSHQQLLGDGSTINAIRDTSRNVFCFGATDRVPSGFADIKISNNDRFVVQSQFVSKIGSDSSSINQRNYNLVSNFTQSSITKLSVISELSNGIGAGSRFTLYKVNTGSA